jgi:hypothetical protein
MSDTLRKRMLEMLGGEGATLTVTDKATGEEVLLHLKDCELVGVRERAATEFTIASRGHQVTFTVWNDALPSGTWKKPEGA